VGGRLVTLTLIVALAFALLTLVPRLWAQPLPGNHLGFEPAQPIAFSHRLHAGELQTPCLYCHSGAERSRHAGTPPAGTCMNCHRFISAPRSAVRAEEQAAKAEKRPPRRVISAELRKLYDALALGDDLKPRCDRTSKPIEWVRIHRLPDFVSFDHRPHVAAAVACQTCHGPVETMERVRQAGTLSMGWCLTCHRTGVPDPAGGQLVAGSTDCSACHY
jgi:cytochrome c7-like protein